MRRAFDIANIYIYIQIFINYFIYTNIHRIIIKFIANYIKGRKSYITFGNTESTRRQFKTVFLQTGVLSSTLVNIYTKTISSLRSRETNTSIHITRNMSHFHISNNEWNVYTLLQSLRTSAPRKQQHNKATTRSVNTSATPLTKT